MLETKLFSESEVRTCWSVHDLEQVKFIFGINKLQIFNIYGGIFMPLQGYDGHLLINEFQQLWIDDVSAALGMSNSDHIMGDF